MQCRYFDFDPLNTIATNEAHLKRLSAVLFLEGRNLGHFQSYEPFDLTLDLWALRVEGDVLNYHLS
jgi:hypothetical protein